jgi:hypothetical protein
MEFFQSRGGEGARFWSAEKAKAMLDVERRLVVEQESKQRSKKGNDGRDGEEEPMPL